MSAPHRIAMCLAMAGAGAALAGDKAVIIDGDNAFDAASGAPIKMPANPESPTVNNRIRGELASALAALKLFDADATVRLAQALSIPVIASGGLSNLDDIRALCAVESEGVVGSIAGRAIYDGSLDFAAAQAEADSLNGD